MNVYCESQQQQQIYFYMDYWYITKLNFLLLWADPQNPQCPKNFKYVDWGLK